MRTFFTYFNKNKYFLLYSFLISLNIRSIAQTEAIKSNFYKINERLPSSYLGKPNEIPSDYFFDPIPVVNEPSNKPILVKIIEDSPEETNVNTQYDRSTMITMLVDAQNRDYSSLIKETFLKQPIPSKFDNFDIPKRVIPLKYDISSYSDLSGQILSYLNNEMKIGKILLSKWFNRDKEGKFNMELVADRGRFNATEVDVATALKSKRGLALLQDAGEGLISNTFIYVYSFRLIPKEQAAKVGGGLLKLAGGIAEGMGVQGASTLGDLSGTVVENINGYTAMIDIYLYQLEWDAVVANNFYNNFWTDAKNYDRTKAIKFDKASPFRVKYVSTFSNAADVTSLVKSDEELIAKLMIKTAEKGFKALEGKQSILYRKHKSKGYDNVKVKANIYSTDPLSAKIGTKEGVKSGDKFYVYERNVELNNLYLYKPIALIKVKGNPWNNYYYYDQTTGAMPGDYKPSYTQFTKVYGKTIYPGALIVKGKLSNNLDNTGTKIDNLASNDSTAYLNEIAKIQLADSLSFYGNNLELYYQEYDMTLPKPKNK